MVQQQVTGIGLQQHRTPVEGLDPPLQPGQFDVDGFTITILGVRNVMRRPFVCEGGVCQDSLRVRVWGEITGNRELRDLGAWLAMAMLAICRSRSPMISPDFSNWALS